MRKFIIALMAAFTVCSARAQYVTTESPVDEVENAQTNVDSLENVITTLKNENSDLVQREKYRKIWKRGKYFNFIYGKEDLEIKSDEPLKLKADIHAGLGIGKTFYLHKKPIAKMIKFGLDWTYFQVDYSKYTYTDIFEGYYPSYGDNSSQSYYDTEDIDMHKAEVGMQIGPSITINPVDFLKLSAYFRYAPSASIFYDGDEVSSGFGSHFVSGFAVSYKVISLGLEGRWGQSKLESMFSISDIEDSYDDPNYGMDEEPAKKSKFKTSGLRFYLSFRF